MELNVVSIKAHDWWYFNCSDFRQASFSRVWSWGEVSISRSTVTLENGRRNSAGILILGSLAY